MKFMSDVPVVDLDSKSSTGSNCHSVHSNDNAGASPSIGINDSECSSTSPSTQMLSRNQSENNQVSNLTKDLLYILEDQNLQPFMIPLLVKPNHTTNSRLAPTLLPSLSSTKFINNDDSGNQAINPVSVSLCNPCGVGNHRCYHPYTKQENHQPFVIGDNYEFSRKTMDLLSQMDQTTYPASVGSVPKHMPWVNGADATVAEWGATIGLGIGSETMDLELKL